MCRSTGCFSFHSTTSTWSPWNMSQWHWLFMGPGLGSVSRGENQRHWALDRLELLPRQHFCCRNITAEDSAQNILEPWEPGVHLNVSAGMNRTDHYSKLHQTLKQRRCLETLSSPEMEKFGKHFYDLYFKIWIGSRDLFISGEVPVVIETSAQHMLVICGWSCFQPIPKLQAKK